MTECELCESPVCKDCVQYLDQAAFAFRLNLPPELLKTRYCPSCHAEKVEPELAAYDEILERARQAFFFFKTQRKPVPILRKAKDVFRVDHCADRDETILRLAFAAAAVGFNAIVEGEVFCTKIRNEGYEKSDWQGTGIGALVDTERLERQDRRG